MLIALKNIIIMKYLFLWSMLCLLFCTASLAQTMKWQKREVTLDSHSARVQLGLDTMGKKITANVFTVDLGKVKYPQIADFDKKLPSAHQALTWQCWNRGTSFLLDELINVPLSGDATGYWNMHLRMTEMYERQVYVSDTEGGDTEMYMRILDSIGAYPANSFSSKPSQFTNGNFRKEHDSIVVMIKRDFEDTDKKFTQATLDSALVMLGRDYGVPPDSFFVNGEAFTPKTFAQKNKLDGNAIIPVVSRLKYGYWDWVGYDPSIGLDVQAKGLNIPAELLEPLMKFACEEGAGFVYGGDAHESYIVKMGSNITIIPKWYCNWSHLNNTEKRQWREIGFTDGSTTANHGYHVYGVKKMNGRLWFLARDTGLGAWMKSETAGHWVHDGAFLALKSYMIDVPRTTLIAFLSQGKNSTQISAGERNSERSFF